MEVFREPAGMMDDGKAGQSTPRGQDANASSSSSAWSTHGMLRHDSFHQPVAFQAMGSRGGNANENHRGPDTHSGRSVCSVAGARTPLSRCDGSYADCGFARSNKQAMHVQQRITDLEMALDAPKRERRTARALRFEMTRLAGRLAHRVLQAEAGQGEELRCSAQRLKEGLGALRAGSCHGGAGLMGLLGLGVVENISWG